MTTIEEFITARLDEDERIAQPIPHGEWRAEVEHGAALVVDSDADTVVIVGDERENAHIARHDPARVLRQVKRDRAIMSEHPRRGQDCGRCQDDFGDYNGADEWMPRNEVYPCPTVKAIASTWAEHPEFQPEWNTP